jgi:predicted amidohydrolase YtcJ
MRDNTADLILWGGLIHTMDKAGTTATAVAVRDGAILAVGTDAEIAPLAGTGARRIDLQGGVLLPGLIDTHTHPPFIGGQTERAFLYDVTSIAEIVERLSSYAEKTTGPIIGFGGNFHPDALAEGRLPAAEDLDRVSTDRPVMITDVNKSIVNSFALRQINTHDVPPDGEVPLGPSGKPLGIFLYTAKSMTPLGGQGDMIMDDISVEEAITRGLAAVAREGFTGALDAWTNMEIIGAYRRLQREQEMPLRVSLMPADALQMDATPENLARAGIHFGLSQGRLTFGPMKLLYDLFIMHRTALMYEPYLGQPENRGRASLSIDELQRRIDGALAAGWPVGIHTTGDHGIDQTLGALVRGIEKAGGAPGRCHLIHAYFPTDKALDTLARHHIAVAVQPPFIHAWGDTLAEVLGEKRAARFYPLRSMLDRGITVGGGADSPIVWHNPWVGIYAAVTRTTQGGRVLNAAEAITPMEAVRIYTRDAAAVIGEEASRGSIEPGKLADFTLIDRDVLSIDPALIPNTKVMATIVGGKVAYRAD